MPDLMGYAAVQPNAVHGGVIHVSTGRALAARLEAVCLGLADQPLDELYISLCG